MHVYIVYIFINTVEIYTEAIMKVFIVVLAAATVVTGAPSHRDDRLGIVGGHDAEKGEFPYQISFQACFLGMEDMCQHICGGAILSPTTVITAASCFPIGSLYTYKIIAGMLTFSDESTERQTIDVSRYVFHPEFDQLSEEYQPQDLAIVVLAKELSYNSYVQPIQLPSQGFYPSGTASISGWGSIVANANEFIFADTLQKIVVSVISDIKTCTSQLQDLSHIAKNLDQNGGSLCTATEIGVSACEADQGGPLVNGDGVLIGIESWVLDPCGQVAAPNVYVNVGAYVDWISAQINIFK